MKYRLILLFLVIAMFAGAQEIIPLPNKYKPLPGVCRVPSSLAIVCGEGAFTGPVTVFEAELKKIVSPESGVKKNKVALTVTMNPAISGKESYHLLIQPTGINLEASDPAGCFYGLQSFIQLIHASGPGRSVSCADITDSPRFGWRGYMLDESRHFFGMEEVKKILDQMALLKLNKFHWHLTDSPGWRIEITGYPKLTTIGSRGNHSDPSADARFYTQEQVREIVRYAADRFIEVIPEIDMPGHASAAARAYPEFSGGGSEKFPDFTFHPGKEATYRFLTGVLKEVATLFPSKYIHLGGDEVSFGNQQWSTFPEVQKLMKDQNLKDLTGVEHYFLGRMSDSLYRMGKTMIGWDEVTGAGLTHKPLVMWWRHEKPAMLELALTKGFDVVLCPRIPLYFDFVQYGTHKSGRKWNGKFAPLESVYAFPSEQFTGGISISSPQVLGIQANLWSETVSTTERLEFMTFPRLAAVAESGWTNQEAKDFDNFTSRIKNLESWWQKAGVTWFDFRNPGNFREIAGPAKP